MRAFGQSRQVFADPHSVTIGSKQRLQACRKAKNEDGAGQDSKADRRVARLKPLERLATYQHPVRKQLLWDTAALACDRYALAQGSRREGGGSAVLDAEARVMGEAARSGVP